MVSIYFEIYKFERFRDTLVTYYQQNNISDPTLPIIPEFSQITFIDDITSDTTLQGYIYGGISSSELNIFFTNDGTQRSSSSAIFKVMMIRNSILSADALNQQSLSNLEVIVYPNPNNGNFEINYNLLKPGDVTIQLYTIAGKKIDEQLLKN